MSNPAIRAKTAAYLLINEEIKDLKARQNNLKMELEPYLQEADTNSRGSHVIAFGEPLEVAGKRYASLQKLRKESKVLNEERALMFLTQDAAFEVAVDNIQKVNQDGLWYLFVEDLITQEELDSFFDTTVTWAFSPVKE